jgi:thiol peroxidase
MSHRTGLVTLKGNPITIAGPGVKVGDAAPDFTVTGADLKDCKLSDLKGKVVVISSVPSLDTAVCDLQTKHFNQDASGLGQGVVVLTISGDLPFAQKRWCAAADAKAVVCVSTFRNNSFGESYGLTIKDGALAGLLARAVLVVDKAGKIIHQQIVPEIAQEPDYAKALEAAKSAL